MISFNCLRRVANGEIVGYAANYTGLMKFGGFLVDVRNKHIHLNLV